MMTRRFLDYNFQGDDSTPNDHALRPSLDEFLIIDWVSVFTCLLLFVFVKVIDLLSLSLGLRC